MAAPTTDTPAATPAAIPEGQPGHAPFGGTPITINPDVPKLEEDVPALIEETRRGWKTTEFWGAVVAVVIDLGLNIDTKDKTLVTILAAVYGIARGIAKNGVPNVLPQTP